MPSGKKQGKRKHEDNQETEEIKLLQKTKRRTRSNANIQEKLEKKEEEENSEVTDCETQPPSHSYCHGSITISNGSSEDVPSILSLPCVDERTNQDMGTDSSLCKDESVSESTHETNTECDNAEKDVDFNSKQPQHLTKDVEWRQSNVTLEMEEDNDSLSILKPYIVHDVSSFCPNISEWQVDSENTGNETNGICQEKENNLDKVVEITQVENDHQIETGHRDEDVISGERVECMNRPLYELFNKTETNSVHNVNDKDTSYHNSKHVGGIETFQAPLKNALRENGPAFGVIGDSKESNQSNCHQSRNNSNCDKLLAISHHEVRKEEGSCLSVTETLTINLGDQDQCKRNSVEPIVEDQPNFEIPSLANIDNSSFSSNCVYEKVLTNINNRESTRNDGGGTPRKGEREEEWHNSHNDDQTDKANKTQEAIVREGINHFHMDEKDIACEMASTSTENVDDGFRHNTLSMETEMLRHNLKQQTALEEDMVKNNKNDETTSPTEVDLISGNLNLVFSELNRSNTKTKSNMVNKDESAYHREVDSSISGNLTPARTFDFDTPAVFHQDSETPPKDLKGPKDTKTSIPNSSDNKNMFVSHKQGCGLSIEQEDTKTTASISQMTIKTLILSQESVCESVAFSSPKENYSVGCTQDFISSSPTKDRPQAITTHLSNLIQQQCEDPAIETTDGFAFYAKDLNLSQKTQKQSRTENPDILLSEYDLPHTMKEIDHRTDSLEIKPMENPHERYYNNKRADVLSDGCNTLKIPCESLKDNGKISVNCVEQTEKLIEINERKVVNVENPDNERILKGQHTRWESGGVVVQCQRSHERITMEKGHIVTTNGPSNDSHQLEYSYEQINKPTVNIVNDGEKKKCCSNILNAKCYSIEKLDKANREDGDNKNIHVSNLPKNYSPKIRRTSSDIPTSTSNVSGVECDSLKHHDSPGRTAMEEENNSLGTNDALLFDIFHTPEGLKSPNDTIGVSWDKDIGIDNRNDIMSNDDVNKNNPDTGLMNTNDNTLDLRENTIKSKAGIDTIKSKAGIDTIKSKAGIDTIKDNTLTHKNQSVLNVGNHNTRTNEAGDKEESNSSTYNVATRVVSDKHPPTTSSKQVFNTSDDEAADDSMMMTDSQLCQVSNDIEMEAEFDERQNEARRYAESKREEGKNLVRIVLNELGNVNRQLLRLKREMDMTKRKMIAGNTSQQNSLQQRQPGKQQQQVTRQPQKQQQQVTRQPQKQQQQQHVTMQPQKQQQQVTRQPQKQQQQVTRQPQKQQQQVTRQPQKQQQQQHVTMQPQKQQQQVTTMFEKLSNNFDGKKS